MNLSHLISKLKAKGPFFSVKSDAPQFAEWLILIFTALLCFMFFLHGDLLVISQWSMAFLTCIYNGNILEVYDVCATQTIHASNYNIMIFGLLAIWQIPMALFLRITEGQFDFRSEYQMSVCTYWSKLLLLLLIFISAYLVYKIALEMRMDKKKAQWAAYVFAASPITLFTSDIFGQIEIMMVTIMLWAILFYMKKKPYHFSILMAFAIPCKFFAVFAFIPLILFIEKRVIHIAKYVAIGLSVYVITTLPFMSTEGYKAGQAIAADYGFLDRFLSVGINSGLGGTVISIPVMLLIFAYIYAYATKLDSDKKMWQHAIYTPFFTSFSVLCLISWHPQWWNIIIPFLVLCLFAYDDFRTGMFCAIALSLAYFLAIVLFFENNVDQALLSRGLIATITQHFYTGPITLKSLLDKLGLNYPHAFNTVMFACLAALLFLFFPNRKKSFTQMDTAAFFPPKSVIYIYHLCIYVYIIPTLALYFFK